MVAAKDAPTAPASVSIEPPPLDPEDSSDSKTKHDEQDVRPLVSNGLHVALTLAFLLERLRAHPRLNRRREIWLQAEPSFSALPLFCQRIMEAHVLTGPSMGNGKPSQRRVRCAVLRPTDQG